jgi:hypothetical protein
MYEQCSLLRALNKVEASMAKSREERLIAP